MDDATCKWREIAGTAGNYFVSDDGQVWSRPRQGAAGGVLKRHWDGRGYAKVCISVADKRRTRRVHRLVLEAFVGPRPEGAECRHLDGDRTNNRLDNLTWGTRSENNYDALQHGAHHNGSKAECIRGHEFTPANTYITVGGYRECHECRRLLNCERRRRKATT